MGSQQGEGTTRRSAYAELNNVETRVGSLLEEVRYHEQRAKRHQRTNVVVSKRVVRWSIIEALAIVCASYYQFYYVKKLFEKRDRRAGSRAFSLAKKLHKSTTNI